jgi:hypothetical protein
VGILERFLAYADDFEKTYVDDDWARLAQYFTEDAVYEGDPPGRGRDGVLAKLRGGVDDLDRRMDRRILDFEPPQVTGNAVSVRFKVIYQKAGAPDLLITGVEVAEFDRERIARMRDVLDADALARFGTWMAEHGRALQAI